MFAVSASLRKSPQSFRKSCAENSLHFSICACHPCAGAMLIFSVSFQLYRLVPYVQKLRRKV